MKKDMIENHDQTVKFPKIYWICDKIIEIFSIFMDFSKNGLFF